jgi:hypothetical protein
MVLTLHHGSHRHAARPEYSVPRTHIIIVVGVQLGFIAAPYWQSSGREPIKHHTRNTTMSRLTTLALAATLALGSVSIATEASAHGEGHGGHGGGHWGDGGHWGGFHRGFGFGPAYGFYPGAECWRVRRVLTPYGWRWQRVNVCYYPYY